MFNHELICSSDYTILSNYIRDLFILFHRLIVNFDRYGVKINGTDELSVLVCCFVDGIELKSGLVQKFTFTFWFVECTFTS